MSNWLKKPKFVSLDDFNKHLKISAPYKLIPYDPRDTEYETIGGNRFVWIDNKQNQHLLYKDHAGDGKAYHLGLDLYDLKERDEDKMEGWEAFRKSLNPYILGYHEGEEIYFKDNEKFLEFKTEQYQWCNLDFANKWLECYSYDINSCFLSFLDYDLPDNKIKAEWRNVQSGEIGFIDDLGYLKMCKKGEYARWIFNKKKYRSLSKFKHVMYNERLKSESQEEKDFWKDCMVKSIGYLKYVNVFLRSAILNYAKARILAAMDENTIYCNTDSIISLKPRNDLDIGINCGQFKVEHEKKLFIFKSIGICVWYKERLKYRGMKKSFIHENKREYWTYSTENVRYDYALNQMIRINKKGVKVILWQKPGYEQQNTETATIQDTTQHSEE